MSLQDKDCYGQSWERDHPECAGGYDVMHTNPVTGTHLRERCSLYDECSRIYRTNDAQRKLQNVALQQVVPVNNLLRQHQIQPYIQPQPMQLNRVQQHYSVPQSIPFRNYATPPQPTPTAPVLAPPAQYYPSAYSPVQMLLPHEAAPFLTSAEERLEGVSIWKKVALESLRAGLKGMLQQGAHIVDHTPYYHQEAEKR